MSSRVYDIAFKLNGQLNGSYKNAFMQAQSIAQGATSAIKSSIMGLAGIVISTAGIKDFVDTYKDYQQEITNTAAIAGVEVGGEEYKALEKAALDAGKATTKTAQESAAALGYMSLAGWDVKESISGLMPVLRLSEATGADLATTSDLVTDSMSALGLEVKDLNKYLDISAQANNKSNQTATQMLEAYIEAGGTFQRLNTSLEESGALLGVLANRGLKGSEAGNKLQSVLINLTKQSGESYKAMEALGISAYDSEGKFIGITETLQKLNEATKNLDPKTRDNYFAMIGGKTQIDTLDKLMGGLNTMTADGVSELAALQAELEHSTGSLDRMADKMNSTLGASFKILGSAWDDFKINTVAQIEPYLTPIIQALAEKLPQATEKAVQFMHKAGGGLKNAWKNGSGLIGIVKGLTSFTGKNAGAVVSAFGAMAILPKIVGAAQGVASVVTVLAANPVAVGLLGAAAAIGAIAYNIKKAHDEAVKANLAEHFGDISLTLAEAKGLAGGLFKNSSYKNFETAAEAFGNAADAYGEYKDAVTQLEKLDYKVRLGLELSETEIQKYKDSIQAEIQAAAEALEQQEYGLHLSAVELLGADSDVTADVAAYYNALEGQCAELGKQLSKAVNDAFADGVLDPDEALDIAQIQENMAKLTSGIFESQRNAKLEMLQMKYGGQTLDAQSYAMMMEEANAINEEYVKNAENSTWQLMAMYDQMLKKGSISYEDYDEKIKEIQKAYMDSRTGFAGDISGFGIDMIQKAYGEEIAGMQPQIDQAYKELLKNVDFSDAETPFLTKFDEFAKAVSKSIDPITRDALKEVWSAEQMQSLIDDASQYLENGYQVPAELAEKIKQSALQGMAAGNGDAMYTYLAMTMSENDPQIAAMIQQYAESWPDSIKTGLMLNKYAITDAGEAIGKETCDRMGAGIDANSGVVIAKAAALGERIKSTINQKLNNIQIMVNASLVGNIKTSDSHFAKVMGAQMSIKGFAGGTTYTPDTFIAGENGAELITNARGYRVYDALETGRMAEQAREVWERFSEGEQRSADIWARRSEMIRGLKENGAQGDTNITVNMPNITINGNADTGTVQQVRTLMSEAKDELLRAVLAELAQREDRRQRLSNE